MTLKTRLTELINDMRDEQLAFDSGLTPADRDEIGQPDNWSAKDMLAHNIVWAGRRLGNLELLEKGEKPPQVSYGDFEEPNRAIFEENRDASWAAVQEMIVDTYGRLDAYLERTSEPDLLVVPEFDERPIWRIIAGNFISHPMWHLWEYLERHGYASVRYGEPFAQRMLVLHEDDAWHGLVYYNLACQHALTGNSAEAIKNLAEALQLNPGLAEWSQQDNDLNSIREEAGYKALYD